MTITTIQHDFIAGKIGLDDLRAKVQGNSIMFPTNVSHKYIAQDGRSFSMPVDEGWVTEVEYDFTVGALTEDTISMIKQLKQPTPPSSGVMPMDTYDFTEEEFDAWKNGLDDSWAEKEWEEWLAEGLIDEGETKEEFIRDRFDNYHHFPREWKEAYDAHEIKLNQPQGELTKVLTNNKLILSKDEAGDYFFKTPYHNHGKRMKADKSAALEYIAQFEAYEVENTAYHKQISQINENIVTLKNSLDDFKNEEKESLPAPGM